MEEAEDNAGSKPSMHSHRQRPDSQATCQHSKPCRCSKATAAPGLPGQPCKTTGPHCMRATLPQAPQPVRLALLGPTAAPGTSLAFPVSSFLHIKWRHYLSPENEIRVQAATGRVSDLPPGPKTSPLTS